MVMQKANSSHDGFGFGIIDMAVIPSQEIIDPMNSGYGNMLGIVQCLGRKCFVLKKCFGQPNHGLCDRQYGNTG